jgi:MoaA/NifB/PqqE/SkfB family radical SAM enzyme
MTTGDVQTAFTNQINVTLRNLLRVFRGSPASYKPLLRVIRHQGAATRRREKNGRLGIPVPPLLIVSTTDACNLRCAGCYAQHLVRPTEEPLPASRVGELVGEASALGVSALLLAGGEPLLDTTWLDALAGHPELGGIVFSNGTLLDDAWLDWFDRNRQILLVISLEGGCQATDARRGAGVFARVRRNMQRLAERRMPFGLSVTLTRQNLAEVESADWVSQTMAWGCKLFVFVEYVPVEPGTDELALTHFERQAFIAWTEQANRTHEASFLVFPGDEEPYGGCLAASRGFVHITPGGDLEPCPFAPFSDRSLRRSSLAEALGSDLLAAIRSQHHRLTESRGGCALWQNRSWVASLLASGSQPVERRPGQVAGDQE